MSQDEFMVLYHASLAYACANAAVVMLPGEYRGERVTLAWAWMPTAENEWAAYGPDPYWRTRYLIEGAVRTRARFEREHGLVPA